MAFDRLLHPFHGPSSVLDEIERRYGKQAASDASGAIEKARADGASWLQILMAILNVLAKGGGIAEIIAAVLALITG